MGIGREEAVNMAIQLEEDGLNFYNETAKKSKNEATKRMFESLAADEVKHIAWIRELAPDVETSGEFNRNTYKRLESIFKSAPSDVQEEAKATEDDIKAIDIAIEMEVKARTEYQRFADESDDPEVKKLFQTLADIELFHAELLDNSKQYLNNPADWFQEEEGWMFDGG